MRNILYPVILFLTVCIPHAAFAADIFDHGIVIAKIVGPSDPTPETAEPHLKGAEEYFLTTIEITDVRNGFLKELKGEKRLVRTGSFDKNLIGKTLPLMVTSRRNQENAKPAIAFGCSELKVAVLGAQWEDRQAQQGKAAK